jgi:UDP-N-acetylmuramate--alanine ligase
VAIFQPHLYSRTARLFAEFARSLSAADEVIVTAIYPAREEPKPGVTGELISDAVIACTPAEYIPTFGDLKVKLRSILGEKLTIIFLSAGDLDAFARTLVE